MPCYSPTSKTPNLSLWQKSRWSQIALVRMLGPRQRAATGGMEGHSSTLCPVEPVLHGGCIATCGSDGRHQLNSIASQGCIHRGSGQMHIFVDLLGNQFLTEAVPKLLL